MPNQPKTSTAKRTPPTPEQIIAEQKIQAEKLTNAKKAPAVALPARAANTAVATPVPDNRTNVQRYLDEVSPASIVGRLIKFSKDGNFILADTDEPVAENAEFVALCGETLVGWIRFHNDGETPPDRVQGLLYDGFQMPTRDTLGDLDETQWPEGPSGRAGRSLEAPDALSPARQPDARTFYVRNCVDHGPPGRREFTAPLQPHAARQCRRAAGGAAENQRFQLQKAGSWVGADADLCDRRPHAARQRR
jgi:hypothetical protein